VLRRCGRRVGRGQRARVAQVLEDALHTAETSAMRVALDARDPMGSATFEEERTFE
jgi:hypothetical protein